MTQDLYGRESDSIARGESDEGVTSADDVTSSGSPGTVKASANGIVSSGPNRYVAWFDFVTQDNADIKFRRSTDYGTTWKPAVNLSQNPGRSINVAVVASGSNVYIVWEQYNVANDQSSVFFRGSIDNGASWGNKTILGNIGKSGQVYPQVAASGSNVFVVWSENNQEILIRRSTDSGASWEGEINLSNNGGISSKAPQLAMSGSNVYVVWEDTIASDREIMFRRSNDNGASWKTATNLSDNIRDSYSPRIAVNGKNVYVVWTDLSITYPNSDVLFRRSLDNGASWKPFINVSVFPGHSFSPQISSASTDVYVTWEQWNTRKTASDVFVRASLDNGSSWKTPVNLTLSGKDRFVSPQIAAYGGKVFVVWKDFNDEILVRRSTDSGASWSGKVLSSSGTAKTAYVATFGSSVSVVWVDSTPSDIMFVRSTDSGASWKQIFNVSNNGVNSLLTESVSWVPS